MAAVCTCSVSAADPAIWEQRESTFLVAKSDGATVESTITNNGACSPPLAWQKAPSSIQVSLYHRSRARQDTLLAEGTATLQAGALAEGHPQRLRLFDPQGRPMMEVTFQRGEPRAMAPVKGSTRSASPRVYCYVARDASPDLQSRIRGRQGAVY